MEVHEWKLAPWLELFGIHWVKKGLLLWAALRLTEQSWDMKRALKWQKERNLLFGGKQKEE